MKPRTLVLRAAGSNCDGETAFAFEQAGAVSERVHINKLLSEKGLLDAYQIFAIPGGFSYGDDISAGRILANQLVNHLGDALRAFVESGRPVIGICNGFQVLVKTDLLPGAVFSRTGQSATLANNDSGRFVDRWVYLGRPKSKCIWTEDLEPSLIELPVAHGEGKFIPASDAIRTALWENGQVALIYTRNDGSPAARHFPENPNGSVDDIAGVCDPSGLVFGLMPHPERYTDPLQHPAWTSHRPARKAGHGLQIFTNAVRHVSEAIGAGV